MDKLINKGRLIKIIKEFLVQNFILHKGAVLENDVILYMIIIMRECHHRICISMLIKSKLNQWPFNLRIKYLTNNQNNNNSHNNNNLNNNSLNYNSLNNSHLLLQKINNFLFNQINLLLKRRNNCHNNFNKNNRIINSNSTLSNNLSNNPNNFKQIKSFSRNFSFLMNQHFKSEQ